ncbi:Hypothetical_protein [Hexamita inflata]|uniref:Hypothetical_protein n=1 Tax=Hexamita inflata TaxID=28002 RepID=A0AA86RLI1_9EUKA|nr:Hypothetical protein HINF_LOCUS66552 [Hexamita inflata]
MENSASLALDNIIESTVDSQNQVYATPTKEHTDIYENRNQWCVVSWISAILVITSGVSIYFIIKSLNDYYNQYWCLGLSMGILVLVLALTGIVFSVYACIKVKSFKAIMIPCYEIDEFSMQ